MNTRGMPAIQRFRLLMQIDASGCWFFRGCASGGKGRFWDGEKHMLAHRFAYEHANGPIADGIEIGQKCKNGLCVNPEHLIAGTYTDTMIRGNARNSIALRENTCAHGHPYTPDNTRIDGAGRRCRTCTRIKDANRKSVEGADVFLARKRISNRASYAKRVQSAAR